MSERALEGTILCPTSEFGQKMFARGRALVLERGVLPAHVMWDADEVLWDWTMSAQRVVRRLPQSLRQRELTHMEFFQLKPGMFELIAGMAQAAQEGGHDGRMRLWTNGYAWRLWAIAAHVPGLATLLGLPEGSPWERFEQSNVVFCRHDYVLAIEPLFSATKSMQWFEQIPWRAREVIKEHLERTPYDSSFKIPELAPLVGKVGFDQVQVLVDDRWANAKRFARTGRAAVHVPSAPLRALFDLLPNASWAPDEHSALAPLGTAVAEKIADALGQLPRAERGVVLTARSEVIPFGYEPARFALEIPDERIRRHWLAPMDELRARHQGARERLVSNLRVIRRVLPSLSLRRRLT